MVGYAIWDVQYSKQFHKAYEPNPPPFTNSFVVVYFHDILIHSKNVKDHMQHIRIFLQILRANKLYPNLKKCEFSTTKLLFLGFVISTKEIATNEGKVESIKS